MTKKLLLIISTVLFLWLVSCGNGNNYNERDFSKTFESRNSRGCILIYDKNENQYIVYNRTQSETRISPASTFKIYNSLIALETEVASDQNFLIEWDGTVYGYKPWNKNHTLKSAVHDSVVWYFAAIAQRIGDARMHQYLDKLNYGNKNMDSGIEPFWLNGGLKISAQEQVELLVKLYQLGLPFSERSQKIVKDMIILESNTVYSLSGKTGLYLDGDKYVGWFVGYIEANNNVYFFATNMEKEFNNLISNFNETSMITKEILRELIIIQ